MRSIICLKIAQRVRSGDLQPGFQLSCQSKDAAKEVRAANNQDFNYLEINAYLC